MPRHITTTASPVDTTTGDCYYCDRPLDATLTVTLIHPDVETALQALDGDEHESAPEDVHSTCAPAMHALGWQDMTTGAAS